jgi:molybdopterin-guanine dinucleotide biosynthesis protein A
MSSSVPNRATAAFILAGGQSTRMGRDKALVPFADKPLIQHALALLREFNLEPQIAGARADLSAFAPVIPDDHPNRGPLSGICTALRHTTTELALFLPVDLPLIPSSLLRYLLHHADITSSPVTIASVNAFPQTFPAVIRRDALPVLETELHAGRASCIASFRTAALSIIPVEMLVQSGQVSDPRALPPYRWFTSLNTPADLHRAEKWFCPVKS